MHSHVATLAVSRPDMRTKANMDYPNFTQECVTPALWCTLTGGHAGIGEAPPDPSTRSLSPVKVAPFADADMTCLEASQVWGQRGRWVIWAWGRTKKLLVITKMHGGTHHGVATRVRDRSGRHEKAAESSNDKHSTTSHVYHCALWPHCGARCSRPARQTPLSHAAFVQTPKLQKSSSRNERVR